MPSLPSPFLDSGTPIVPPAPDEAAASSRSHAPGAAAEIPDDLKQRLLAAIEDDYRFVLDVGKFMFDIGYVPPAARPENFEKYMAMLDELIDNEEPPIFLQRTG